MQQCIAISLETHYIIISNRQHTRTIAQYRRPLSANMHYAIHAIRQYSPLFRLKILLQMFPRTSTCNTVFSNQLPTTRCFTPACAIIRQHPNIPTKWNALITLHQNALPTSIFINYADIIKDTSIHECKPLTKGVSEPAFKCSSDRGTYSYSSSFERLSIVYF